MACFYRFIDSSERRQLWSISSILIILMTLSWYYIEYMLSNDECYEMLKQDYYSSSLYIDVPDSCRSWTVFWFRINQYTIYAVYLFSIYVLMNYPISTFHVFTRWFTFVGLMLHCFPPSQEGYIFYYQGPTLLHLLVLVLYLEKEPFEDSKMGERYVYIRWENDERSDAQLEIMLRSQSEAIRKMRECDSNVEIEQVMEEVDEQLEKDLLRCQLLDYPVLTPPEPKKKNILFILFIYVILFLLFVLAVWSPISMLHRRSVSSSNPKNSTHTP